MFRGHYLAHPLPPVYTSFPFSPAPMTESAHLALVRERRSSAVPAIATGSVAIADGTTGATAAAAAADVGPTALTCSPLSVDGVRAAWGLHVIVSQTWPAALRAAVIGDAPLLRHGPLGQFAV